MNQDELILRERALRLRLMAGRLSTWDWNVKEYKKKMRMLDEADAIERVLQRLQAETPGRSKKIARKKK